MYFLEGQKKTCLRIFKSEKDNIEDRMLQNVL